MGRVRRGTIDGKVIHAGDSLIANVDTPAQTTAKWNTVQSNLTYVPEDVANKSTNVTTDGASDTKYPSVKAVKTYADGKVSLNGNETIAGIKTFSSSPIVPSPTTASQVATKAYVDAGIVNIEKIKQTTGTSETDVMSQKAVTVELATKADHGYEEGAAVKTLKEVDDDLRSDLSELEVNKVDYTKVGWYDGKYTNNATIFTSSDVPSGNIINVKLQLITSSGAIDVLDSNNILIERFSKNIRNGWRYSVIPTVCTTT